MAPVTVFVLEGTMPYEFCQCLSVWFTFDEAAAEAERVYGVTFRDFSIYEMVVGQQHGKPDVSTQAIHWWVRKPKRVDGKSVWELVS